MTEDVKAHLFEPLRRRSCKRGAEKMTRFHRVRRYHTALFTLFGLANLVIIVCGSVPPAPTPIPTVLAGADLSQIITLGDLDPEDPVKKIKRFNPLADYLAEHLREHGIREGRVIVARDIAEMARYLLDGTVDIYFDSPFPTLAVHELSNSEVILRRWKQGDPTYWSTYLALKNNGIAGVEDFVGKIIAFEEPHSTSGFVLPAGTLMQRGFTLREVDGPGAGVAPDEIGYLFTWDEQDTVEMVLQGRVAGGGVSNQDYEELPAELKQQVVAFDRTVTVPRNLVSIRPGLDRGLAGKVRELLIGLDETSEGRQILEGLKQTRKFDPLPPDSQAGLSEFDVLVDLLDRN